MKMLAAVYHGPEDLRLEEILAPEIGPGELLLQVTHTSICGTDLRILHGDHRKYPPGTVRIPGHEVVGVLAVAGSGLEGYTPGQRFFIAPNMGCGHCRQCVTGNNNRCADYIAIGITLDGSFAEYMRVPAQAVQQGNVIPVSEDVDPAVAALIEPLACVLRGQDALDIQPGETVLIMGAGPIGIMHLKLARLRGAGKVIVSEPLAERAAQAARLGADQVVNPLEEDLSAVLFSTDQGQGADAIIVATPVHQAQESAPYLAAIGGRVNFFGGLPKDQPVIKIDSNLVHYKELRLTGTTACSTGDCHRAARIVNSGRIDLSDLVSRRFPLGQVAQAVAAAENRQSLKVVLEP